MEVKFTDINFTIQELRDGKKVDRPILKNIAGTIEPGKMVALMGASGAGKSTLLNVLSRRALAHDGSIFYDANEATVDLARAKACFIQQEDIFFGKLTVFEHLMFQAKLRLPKSLGYEERKAVVESSMKRLGLKKCRDSRIGNVQMGEGRGISGGEQKRLNVATELLTSPSIIFADEPTTGLDSFVAQAVVISLRNLARNNRTVVATIHQPSSKIFEMFHSLLLLAEGRLIFYGPREAAVDYFEHLGCPCPAYTNPADFLIKTCALTDANRATKIPILDEWSEKWANEGEAWLANWESQIKAISTEKKRQGTLRAVSLALEGSISQEKLKKLESEVGLGTSFDAVKSPELDEDESDEEIEAQVQFVTAPTKGEKIGKFAMFGVLFQRCSTCNRRDFILVQARLAQTVIMGLLMGFIFFDLGWETYDARSKLGASFMFLLNQGMLGSIGVTQTFPDDKPIVQREYESGIVSPVMFFYSKICADLAVQIFFPFLFHTIVWWLVNMNPKVERWAIGYGVIVLVANAAISIGYLTSCISPSTDVALTIAQAIQLPLLQFSGFLVKLEDVPAVFRWIQWLSPYKYGYSAYVTNVFYDETVILPQGNMLGQEFVDTYLGIKASDFIPFMIALGVYLVVVRIIASFGLWFNMSKTREYK